MRALWPVLLLGACSSSSTPAVDLAPADLSAGVDARREQPPRDLPPDAPRPPASWKTVMGAPQAYRHTATLLKNGDVLIVGGWDKDDKVLAGAYRYLAATGQFVPAGKLATPRVHHTASLLPDGRVLVAGGHSAEPYVPPGETYLRSTELYDPEKPAASAWSAGPELLLRCSEHAAVTLADGRILLSGGWSAGIDSNGLLQLYDPASSAFQLAVSTLKVPRRRHTATLLKNGRVLLAGGVQGTGAMDNWLYLDSLEVFDPVPATTSLLAAKMTLKRMGHSATLLLDGRVLIAGGYCIGFKCTVSPMLLNDLYDPATDAVISAAHPGEYPLFHTATRLDDGRVLVAGGTITDATKAYAFVPGPPPAWSTLPPLAVGRTLATATKLLDGTVLVVGGSCIAPPACASPLPDTAERFIP
jgi:hypothetical protein